MITIVFVFIFFRLSFSLSRALFFFSFPSLFSPVAYFYIYII